jgi:uncharacterized membrane protein
LIIGGGPAIRTAIAFLRATLIGGVMFLLPVGVVIVVAGKLFAISRSASQALHDTLFPEVPSRLLPFLGAILVLVVIAFVAGLFARTVAGRRVFSALEDVILSRLPVYTLLKQTLADMAGGAARLSGEREVTVVLVRFDDHRAPGFVVDRAPGGEYVVFLPGAPSAFTGQVVLVSPDRIEETNFTPQDVLGAMRRLGSGVAAMNRRSA